MIKKDGYAYCDYCGMRLVDKKRRGSKMVVENKGKKQLTFCNWTCAYHGSKPTSSGKNCLRHLSLAEQEELLNRLGYAYINQIYLILNKSKVNYKKFTEIVLCDNPSVRRDEFYKLFKYENNADVLWIRLMNWYYGYTEKELVEHMWDTMEEIHKAFGFTD